MLYFSCKRGVVLKVENIDVISAIESTRDLLKKDKNTSLALKAAFELLITVITLLINQKGLNSTNSSKPPSQDPNRKKKSKKTKATKKKPGAQKGHKGSTLEQTDSPDKVEHLTIDKKSLPQEQYTHIGFESRQVFDITIATHVTEYRSEVLEDSKGNQYTATFPEGVNNPTQYGKAVKAHSVYMSQFQLIPLDRVRAYFNDQMGLPISKGSVSNFNALANLKLQNFEAWAKKQLLNSPLNNADETGVNVNGKRLWFHLLSNEKTVLYQVDQKRGKEAMDRMGVLPDYKGIVCHDHWKPYYKYSFTHALCNAHHLRELERAFEQDGQAWAKKMQKLLCAINDEVNKTKAKKLSKTQILYYEKEYRAILTAGEKESPLMLERPNGSSRGKIKQTKSRNLLDRLIDFENDTLRFMKESIVPFTNNSAENDLRMTKVQQKISGCFRSLTGAESFCRIRSYLLTCQKNGIQPTKALELLFSDKTPDFMNEVSVTP